MSDGAPGCPCAQNIEKFVKCKILFLFNFSAWVFFDVLPPGNDGLN